MDECVVRGNTHVCKKEKKVFCHTLDITSRICASSPVWNKFTCVARAAQFFPIESVMSNECKPFVMFSRLQSRPQGMK